MYFTLSNFIALNCLKILSSSRYEFFHVRVAKRTDRQSESIAGSLFGVRETVFHVLMVSNSAAAWRRIAVCSRTYDEFCWLSEHLKQ